jgi:hypothetical protein
MWNRLIGGRTAIKERDVVASVFIAKPKVKVC